jgi:transcription elongation factor SPT6
MGTNVGGKTPYAGRTPGHRTPGHRTPGHRTPGHRTPGHRTPGAMSIRQAGRTPNPYESAGPGGHVNPQRAAMIESTGGWGSKGY